MVFLVSKEKEVLKVTKVNVEMKDLRAKQAVQDKLVDLVLTEYKDQLDGGGHLASPAMLDRRVPRALRDLQGLKDLQVPQVKREILVAMEPLGLKEIREPRVLLVDVVSKVAKVLRVQ